VRKRPLLAVSVGSVQLPNPVMTASGTAGRADELAGYVDLAALGAVVAKSVAWFPWPGNPPPRLRSTPAGMLNSVGLEGPGVAAWVDEELPALVERGARVVASIWGRRAEDYERAAAALEGVPGLVALEVNVSCPNVEARNRMFAHSPAATAEAVEAAGAARLPRWAKLSPNVTDLLEVANAALEAGAEALVVANTLMGMAIDVRTGRYALGSGAGGGGLSGPAIRPVVVRLVHDCRAAFPHAGIVAAGGVARGVDAVEMLMAGADAVQVGTATFHDPRAPLRVLRGLVRCLRRQRVGDVRAVVGVVHRGGLRAKPPAPGPSEQAPARGGFGLLERNGTHG
jgi:dihydroorotate dehydrogenase (NAD+) catalytic subunit